METTSNSTSISSWEEESTEIIDEKENELSFETPYNSSFANNEHQALEESTNNQENKQTYSDSSESTFYLDSSQYMLQII